MGLCLRHDGESWLSKIYGDRLTTPNEQNRLPEIRALSLSPHDPQPINQLKPDGGAHVLAFARSPPAFLFCRTFYELYLAMGQSLGYPTYSSHVQRHCAN